VIALSETIRVYLDRDLLDTAKKQIPETEGLTYSGLAEFLIRRSLQKQDKETIQNYRRNHKKMLERLDRISAILRGEKVE